MAVTTELVLIRHGETDWNKAHRLQGQANPGPPLNDMGIQQTQMLCHVLQKRYAHFDAVVSSDLQRTMQTAQILAAPYQLQIQQHPGLRERHIGALQGLTNKEAPLMQPEAWAALQSGDHASRIPGGGESLDDLKARLSATLLDIAAQHPGKRVLVISHGGALHATHRATRGYEAQGKVMNCSISVVMAELEGQRDGCQGSQDSQDQLERVSDSSSCDDDVVMRSSPSSSVSMVAVQQLEAGLGLLFNSSASQASGCCSSSCCGCCYCMGDACEGSCIAAVDGADEEGDEAEEDHMLLSHRQQGEDEEEDWRAEVARAAAKTALEWVVSGKLSMLVWNDTAALFDLEAEEGVGMRAAGFGGCAREA